MDDLTFKWKITRLETEGERNEVSRVFWTITGNKDDHSYSISGFTNLPKYDSAQGRSFIPFDNLNHDIITEWINNHIGSIINGYKSIITKNLDSIPKRTLVSKIPMWD